MADSSILNIAPDGDVVLVCGSDQQRFRVSSTVLSLGSSVFKALLSPHFREGSQLASAPEVEIPLPEDDAGALATVIEVMHMTATTTTPKPSPEELLAIAIVADKYDCLAAVTYATHVWISRRSMDVEGADISTLFIAAALLEHDDLFASIGKTLILDSQGEIKKVIVESGIAWHAVFDELRRVTQITRASIQDMLDERLTTKLGSHRIMFERGCISKGNCNSEARQAVMFSRAFYAAGLWPAEQARRHSPNQLLENVECFVLEWPSDIDTSCACYSAADGIMRMIRERAGEIRHHIPRICLKCVKELGNDYKCDSPCKHLQE